VRRYPEKVQTMLINTCVGQTLILLGDKNGPGATFTTGDKYDAECSNLANTLPGGAMD
jgi:hypothetical protein